MRPLQRTFFTIATFATAMAAGLVGCSSAPVPPVVDKDTKRPANTAMAVELQLCQHDLHNTRLRAAESTWISETLTASQQHIRAMQHNLRQLQQAMAGQQLSQKSGTHGGPRTPEESPATLGASDVAKANSLYLFHFDYGSAKVKLSASAATAITQEALLAPLIVLRGRTDGHAWSSADAAIAKARAFAVRDLLIAGGVDPRRIRSSYQAVGDHVADNSQAEGRRLNRRVELEIYRSPPRTVGAATAPQISRVDTAVPQ